LRSLTVEIPFLVGRFSALLVRGGLLRGYIRLLVGGHDFRGNSFQFVTEERAKEMKGDRPE
jgi:hypothetical protein